MTTRSDLRTSKQGHTLLCPSTELDKTWGVQGVLWVPGSRDDAGRVWKPLTTTRSGSAEKLQQRDKEVLLQAQDRDQTQARRLVVPGPGKSPVVDGGWVGCRWECAQGRTGRCC